MGNVARFKRIYIEITSSCNLKCSFCQETLRSPHFMSVDEFAHTLQQIRPYTNYIYLRSHKDRDMKVIGGERMAVNQDAIYKIVGWAGNMTMSNAALQGVLIDKGE